MRNTNLTIIKRISHLLTNHHFWCTLGLGNERILISLYKALVSESSVRVCSRCSYFGCSDVDSTLFCAYLLRYISYIDKTKLSRCMLCRLILSNVRFDISNPLSSMSHCHKICNPSVCVVYYSDYCNYFTPLITHKIGGIVRVCNNGNLSELQITN
jgi:hypothetical protein